MRGALPATDRARLAEAQRLQQRGQLAEAESLLRQLLQRYPSSFDTLQAFGVFACQLGRHADGVQLFRSAISIDSEQPDTLVNLARALHATGQLDTAVACLEIALSLDGNDDAARLAGAGWLVQAGREAGAARLLQPMKDDAATGHAGAFRAGRAAQALRDLAGALRCFERAIEMGRNESDVFIAQGELLFDAGRSADAADAFSAALTRDAHSGAALRGCCRALLRLRKFDLALQMAERAVVLESSSGDAWNLHGAVLSCIERLSEAVDSLRRSLQIDPNQRPALANLANVLQTLHRYEDAALVFERLLVVWPDCEFVKGRLLHSKMLICDWLNHDKLLAEIERDIDLGLAVAEPFGMQGYCSSPQRLQSAARVFGNMFHVDRSGGRSPPDRAVHAKIRVGYVSGEFRQQATSILLVHLLELHDKSRFEIYAFDNGKAVGSSSRQRIEAAVTELIPIANLGEDQVAHEVRARGIDILVNLNGYFGRASTDVFSLRPAPVQVSFLGFPGTMGVPYMDYLVADAIVVPPAHRGYYDEAIVQMPDSYQPNDARRPVAAGAVARREHGLPDIGFVFCNFNNAYKITPDVFSVWMRLLARVPGSVLWLLEVDDAEVVRGNLVAEAQWRGVDGSRLVFAPHVSVEQHIARLALADLVLDTLPYNAHTTGSDALWAGVPMITCLGDTFPGRVGASLLTAAGLPELITQSLPAYEALALQLATSEPECQALRARLARNRSIAPLFDTDRYRRNLEAAFEEMVRRARQGLPPSLIEVTAHTPVASASWNVSVVAPCTKTDRQPHEQDQVEAR